MFTVPTWNFRVLYVFVLLSIDRRRIAFANVTTNPTADWLAQQVVNAFPYDTAPQYILRDRDGAYGARFSARMKHLGIKELKSAPRTPNMNAHCERVIGSLRRELFDHVIAVDENHVRRLMCEYIAWYNADRCHLALNKDPPDGREVEPESAGKVVALKRLGGLHHRYTRRAA